MSQRRQEIVERILSERDRQSNLPGSEWDTKNLPNDWISIAASYCLNSCSRKHTIANAEDFEDDLVKAAAVIIAALENVENMKASGKLS